MVYLEEPATKKWKAAKVTTNCFLGRRQNYSHRLFRRSRRRLMPLYGFDWDITMQIMGNLVRIGRYILAPLVLLLFLLPNLEKRIADKYSRRWGDHFRNNCLCWGAFENLLLCTSCKSWVNAGWSESSRKEIMLINKNESIQNDEFPYLSRINSLPIATSYKVWKQFIKKIKKINLLEW